MKGLVLSGGKGTRLRPLTYTGAKQLVPVANKPILFYALEDLVEAGVSDIGIIISPETGEQVQQETGDGARFGARLTYILQPQPLGIAHGIKIAQDFVGAEPFILFLGDNFIRGGIVPQVNAFRNEAMDAQIILYEMQDPSSMGVAVLNGDGRVQRVVEKPKQFISPYAVIGIYMFGPSVFDAVNNIKPSARGELEITDTIQYLVDKGLNVRAHKLADAWVDTGRIGDMLEANRLVLDIMESKNQGTVQDSIIEGRVILEEGARVVSSKIRGPAIIGKRTVVQNAFVGPYTSIHYDCVVSHCEIEHSIVLEQSCLENLHTRIADSLIGRNVQIKHAEGPTKTIRLMLGDFSQVGI
ncbi:MAG: glucose-1-phosphate thymidylyltransferase [Chloroflexi bacterium]|nr:glucose-1-phosphate thymidylyltransferase [Chloroflexota bacterium]